MQLVLEIQVLQTMMPQTFRVKCLPETLVVERHPSDTGYIVEVATGMEPEESGLTMRKRFWFAYKIVKITFKEVEEDVPAQSTEKLRELSEVTG